MHLITVDVFAIKDAATAHVERRDPVAYRRMCTVEDFLHRVRGDQAPCLLCGKRIGPVMSKRFATMTVGDDDGFPACAPVCDRCGRMPQSLLVGAATTAFSAWLPTQGSA